MTQESAMPRSALSTLAPAALALLLAACGGGGGDAGTLFPPPTTVPVCTASAPIPSPGASAPQVTLTLSNGAGVNGDVVLTLDAGRAPVTAANFLSYVNAGFFDGTVFHRRSPGFVLQGGGFAGPLTAGGALPTEKATRPPIALEDNAGLSNLCLTVAMARTATLDSATSQFFVNLANNPALDRTLTSRGYAVFGSVTSGSEVISAASTAGCTAWPAFLPAGDCLPTPNITITRARQTR
jgi:cyclophilin family peptidyl-prolyl cis-trans isomerase